MADITSTLVISCLVKRCLGVGIDLPSLSVDPRHGVYLFVNRLQLLAPRLLMFGLRVFNVRAFIEPPCRD